MPEAIRAACDRLRSTGSGFVISESRGGVRCDVEIDWMDRGARDLIRVGFREVGDVTRRIHLSELPEGDLRMAELLLRGRTDQEIAEMTGSSVARIKAGLRAVYSRHRVQSRVELLAALF